MKPIEIIKVPHIELCSVNLILPIGQVNDPYDLIGITHLIEHLIFHAHPNYSQEEFMIKIEEMGGIFNAITEKEMTIIYGKIQIKYINEVIKLFKEAIDNLPNCLSHIDSEKAIILTELNSASQNSYQRIRAVQHQLLFEATPYQFNQILKNNVATITKDNLLKFTEHYNWKYWRLLVVGNVEDDIEVDFEGLEPILKNPLIKRLEDNKRYTANGKVSGITISVLLPEYFNDLESIIISNILFKGIASPFYSEVIKQNGIAYNIENSVNRYQNSKYMEFGWLCKDKHIELSINILNSLIEKTVRNEIGIENFIHGGIQKTRTEILLIKENFIRYSNHVTKQIALETFLKNDVDVALQCSVDNILKYSRTVFEQPILIGSHIRNI